MSLFGLCCLHQLWPSSLTDFGLVSQKILSPLVLLSMQKTMVAKVISELKYLTGLKLFQEADLVFRCWPCFHQQYFQVCLKHHIEMIQKKQVEGGRQQQPWNPIYWSNLLEHIFDFRWLLNILHNIYNVILVDKGIKLKHQPWISNCPFCQKS